MNKFGPRGTLAAACLSFVALGTITGSLGPALPELAAHTGSSLGAVGSVVTALFVGAFGSLLAAGPLFDRFGQYPVLLAGAVLVGLGAVGLTIGPTLPLVLLATGCAGLGHGAVNIGGNVLIGEVFSHRRAAVLNLLSVFFGLGAVIGPLTASLTVRLWNTALPALWLGAGIMLLQVLLIPRLAVVPPVPAAEAGQRRAARGLRDLLQSPVLWTLGVLMLTYVGLENGMSSWTTTYLVRTAATSASVGALASAGFWLALACGRMAAAGAAGRFSPRLILVITLAGALSASILLLATTGNGPLTAAAVLLTGFFYGPVFPTVFAITTGTFRGLAGTAGSLVSAMGNAGAAVLPWLQGLLLVNAGPSASILLIAAGSITMLVLFGGYHLIAQRQMTGPHPTADLIVFDERHR